MGDRLQKRFDRLLRLQRARDGVTAPDRVPTVDPISSDEDDRPRDTNSMLESRLRQLQRRSALDRQRSSAATRLQSRFRGNRIRTLKRRNRETLDRMRHNVEQMKRDPYIDEFRSRFFAPDDSIIHKYTRHGMLDLMGEYVKIERRKNELSRLIDEFKYKYIGQPGVSRSTTLQDEHNIDMKLLEFDNFIKKYLELPPDVKKIIIDSSISMNLDKSALELYDSSDEEEYDSDEEPNTFYIYLKELQIGNKLYRLTQLIVENLQSITDKLQAYRYTCDFVEFLIDNYH